MMTKYTFYYKEHEITYYLVNNEKYPLLGDKFHVYVDLQQFYRLFLVTFPQMLTFDQWIENDKKRRTSNIEFLEAKTDLTENQLIIIDIDKKLVHFKLAFIYICNNHINDEELHLCYFNNWYQILN